MSVEKKNENGRRNRTERVKRIKKAILLLVTIAIIVPTILCIILFMRLRAVEEQIKDLCAAKVLLDEQLLKQEDIIEKTASEDPMPGEVSEENKSGQEAETNMDTRRRVYLTFDDGPSANTSKILDVLQEYNVKATFFVVGKTDAVSINNYKRIVAEGHTLGMHSFSHKYNEIYASKEAYIEDLTKLQDYLYEITGVKSHYVRFPGGSSNQVSRVNMQELIQYLNKNEIIYYDWNIASGDADAPNLSTDKIVNNCLSKIEVYNKEAMILMHDANDKRTTVEALPMIIEQIQNMDDNVIVPITDETVPVQHVTAKVETATEP